MVKGTTSTNRRNDYHHAQGHERRREQQQQQQQQRRVLKDNVIVTESPSSFPTNAPTRKPTPSPVAPTMAPVVPVASPTRRPTSSPTQEPTVSPTSSPTQTLTSLAPTTWESQWTQHLSLVLSALSPVEDSAASTREHLANTLASIVCDTGAVMVDRELTNVCPTNNRQLQLVIPSSTVLWQEPLVVIASCPEELELNHCFTWNFTYSVLSMGDQRESDLQSALDTSIQDGFVNDDALQGTGIVTSVVGQEQSLILSTSNDGDKDSIPDGVAFGLQILGGAMMLSTVLFVCIVTRWARLRRISSNKRATATTVPSSAPATHGLQTRDGVEAMLQQSRQMIPSSTSSSTASQSTTMASHNNNNNALERQPSGRSLSSSEDRLVTMAKQAAQNSRFPGSNDAPIRALLPTRSGDSEDQHKADDEEDYEDSLFVAGSNLSSHTYSSEYESAVSVLTGTGTASRAPTPIQFDHWSTIPGDDEASLPTPTTSEVDHPQ